MRARKLSIIVLTITLLSAVCMASNITVASPNGGEVWAAGSTQSVQWTASGVTGNVNIALLKAGLGRQAIAVNVPVTAGSVAWTLPVNLPAGNDYKVRITSATTGTIIDYSNATFSILAAPGITSPNGGEVWAAGSTQSIQWTSTGLTGSVNIALLKAGLGRQAIAVNVPVTAGSVNWTLPVNLPAGNDYTVRITSSTTGTIFDYSNAPFSITAAPGITSPNGGEVWAAGSTQSIQWTASGATGNVNIALLKAGVGRQAIAVNVPVTAGSVNWTLPLNLPAGNDYTVRIASATTGTIFDYSNAPFSITAVTAPVPVFSSLPPSAASEAVAYRYSMTAVDPAGTNVTYALKSAPTGAALAGNTLTWTPTPAQSRVSNSFTVTATSAAGGTATQTWTVTPDGTVTVKNIDTYWAVNGPQTSPNDLSLMTIAALVPQADGSLLTLNGTIAVDGLSFTIPGVAAGHYWLQVDASDFYWTSTSSFDFGSDFAGQPNPGSIGISTSLYWNITGGLTPWVSPPVDNLFAVVPNEDPTVSFQPSSTPLADGDTAFSTQFPDPTLPGDSTFMPPVSPFQGDVTYLLQTTVDLSNPAIQILKTDSIGQTTSLSVAVDGDVSSVHASMTPLSAGKTMDLNIDFGAYNQAQIISNPNSTASGFFGLLWKQPIVTDRAVQNWISPMALLNFSSTAAPVPSTVQDFLTFNYGNGLPVSWPTLYYFDEFGAVAPQGAATAQIFYDIGHVGTAIPTAAQADAPVMSAIQNPTINGLDFFTPQTVGGALTLSWNAPTGLLPATGYRVDLYAVDPATGIASLTPTSLFTATSSITIPSQALVAGSYVFNVEAQADPLANMETAPKHNGYPQAWADAVSGVVTYTGSATAGPFVPAVKVAAAKMQARQMRRALAARSIQRGVVKH